MPIGDRTGARLPFSTTSSKIVDIRPVLNWRRLPSYFTTDCRPMFLIWLCRPPFCFSYWPAGCPATPDLRVRPPRPGDLKAALSEYPAGLRENPDFDDVRARAEGLAARLRQPAL